MYKRYNVHPIRNPTTTAHDFTNVRYVYCFDKQNRDDMKTFFIIYLNFSVQCQQVCQFCPLAGCLLWERGRRSNSSAWPLGILHRPSSGLKRSNTTFGFSHGRLPLPAVTRDGRKCTYDVSALKKIGGRMRTDRIPLKLQSPTKLARLGHSPPGSKAGHLAGAVFYVYFFSLVLVILYEYVHM